MKIDFIRVRNMTSPKSGKEVANQFIINTASGKYFQSYRTVIAAVIGGKIYLDQNAWDCSATTGKYRNLFLGENKLQTEKKIESGIYELTDLNIGRDRDKAKWTFS